MNILQIRDACVDRLPADVRQRYIDTEADVGFLALALCGEVGELANLIKKELRDKVRHEEAIRDELADIRVYLELLARCYGIPGDELTWRVSQKLNKIVERYNDQART